MKSKKLKKPLMKIGIFLFFIILLVLPLIMMFVLSKNEMSKYRVNSSYKFKEAAYGEIKRVTRQDVKMYYTFSGTVTSEDFVYINLPSGDNTVSSFSVGDEIFEGDIIAQVDSESVKSTCNGIVEEAELIPKGYIKVRSFDNLELSCSADISKINKVRNCDNLKLSDGTEIKVKKVSNVMSDNLGKIVFSLGKSDYMYGQEVNNLKIYTGKVYSDVLTVDKDCVYQKEKNGPYFVRVVDEDGYFECESEVEIGFETEDVVSVLNIEEDTLCDSGYKELLETQSE